MLHYETVTPYLRAVLERLMADPLFDAFRLVGGTSLSLRLGHRFSIDIDLFPDEEYASLDFHAIQTHLRDIFPYCMGECGDPVGMGASYIVGTGRANAVKVDLFYTDPFIGGIERIDGVRLASIEDIIAMKLEVISHGGRKKDFWDIHELSRAYTLGQMLALYEKRYPYGSAKEALLSGLSNFAVADAEPDPNCLKGKDWPCVKSDLLSLLRG